VQNGRSSGRSLIQNSGGAQDLETPSVTKGRNEKKDQKEEGYLHMQASDFLILFGEC
jgi:hypothetical protein